MKTTMHHQSPIMNFIAVTIGFFTGILSNPSDLLNAFLNGMVAGLGTILVKILYDKIVNYFKK